MLGAQLYFNEGVKRPSINQYFNQFRVQLYKKLLKAGYQVLAIDYRGFADSTEIRDITETTVVEDSRVALQYVRWYSITPQTLKKVYHGQELLRQEGAESDQGSGVGALHGLRHLAKHDGQGEQSIFLRNTSWGPGRAPPPMKT